MCPADEAHGAAGGVASLPYRPCVGIMVLNAEGLVWRKVYASVTAELAPWSVRSGNDPVTEPALRP